MYFSKVPKAPCISMHMCLSIQIFSLIFKIDLTYVVTLSIPSLFLDLTICQTILICLTNMLLVTFQGSENVRTNSLVLTHVWTLLMFCEDTVLLNVLLEIETPVHFNGWQKWDISVRHSVLGLFKPEGMTLIITEVEQGDYYVGGLYSELATHVLVI